jgi:hypothetical protein
VAKGTKAFRIDGEDFAEVCHMGSATGPLIVDIGMRSGSVAGSTGQLPRSSRIVNTAAPPRLAGTRGRREDERM